MITKEYISELKSRGNGDIATLVNAQKDVGTIVYVLENLGHLPENFNADFLYNLLNHTHSQVRLHAVKNIAKLNGKSDTQSLYTLYQKENDTSVRREIVSAIGRQRERRNKPLLYSFLNDGDPKIICQAIRGLLVFENDKEVEEHLRPLVNHENEMVRTVIYKEYFAKEKSTHPDFYIGDSLTILKNIASQSIDFCMTSPPYWGQRCYENGGIGLENKPEHFIENILEITGEIKRVLKNSGSFWLNIGDTYKNKALQGIPWRIAIKMIDEQGWILRNDVVWNKHKGAMDSSTDKLRNIHEMIFHFVKTTDYYYNDDAIRQNPQTTTVKNGAVVSSSGVCGVRYKRQIELSTALSEVEKENAMRDLLQVLKKVEEGEIPDFRMIIRNQQRATHSDSEKVSGRAKELKEKGYYFLLYSKNGALPTDVWEILPEDTQNREKHYAVYPEDLCKIPILATCPPDGIVLDPFCGSGTTNKVAYDLHRKSIGIDISEEYINIAKQRVSQLQLNLL